LILEIEYLDRIIDKIKSDPEPESQKAIEIFLWEGVKDKAIRGRRVGCGITGLGDMIAALNLKYDSPRSNISD
jgi:ribonucleoside-diphosphate reductase alpha chain